MNATELAVAMAKDRRRRRSSKARRADARDGPFEEADFISGETDYSVAMTGAPVLSDNHCFSMAARSPLSFSAASAVFTHSTSGLSRSNTMPYWSAPSPALAGNWPMTLVPSISTALT